MDLPYYYCWLIVHFNFWNTWLHSMIDQEVNFKPPQLLEWWMRAKKLFSNFLIYVESITWSFFGSTSSSSLLNSFSRPFDVPATWSLLSTQSWTSPSVGLRRRGVACIGDRILGRLNISNTFEKLSRSTSESLSLR